MEGDERNGDKETWLQKREERRRGEEGILGRRFVNERRE